MPYDISITSIDPEPYFAITATTDVQKIAQTLGECYGELMAFLGTTGNSPTSAPFARYLRMEQDGTVEVEAGVTVEAAAGVHGRIHTGTHPGGEAATTIHHGPYENIYDAVMALQAWMKDQGREPAGAHWEHYVDDPMEVPPEQLRTVLYWPLV